MPIHWLFYPSVQFASVNEPPELFLNLIKGQPIFGNQEQIQEDFRAVAEGFSCLAGLDWLTDSLRVLLANINIEDENQSFQPKGFLKSLAMHNLEYFWKWQIVGQLAKNNGQNFNNWNQLESLNLSKRTVDLVNLIRNVRHQGEGGQVTDIVNLHELTFALWSTLN